MKCDLNYTEGFSFVKSVQYLLLMVSFFAQSLWSYMEAPFYTYPKKTFYIISTKMVIQNPKYLTNIEIKSNDDSNNILKITS